jgi:hypothetical protein
MKNNFSLSPFHGRLETCFFGSSAKTATTITSRKVRMVRRRRNKEKLFSVQRGEGEQEKVFAFGG